MSKIKISAIFLAVALLCSSMVFATVGSKSAKLSYNNIMITLEGEEIVPTDANGNAVEPFIIDGTTYLPVRGVANFLGLDVAWDGATKTVKLTKPEVAREPVKAAATGRTDTVETTLHYNNIKITLDENEIIPTDANGNPVEPFIIDGTTYLPVRGVASALGLEVEWDNVLKIIKLTKMNPVELNMIREGEISMLKNTHYRLTVDKELNVAYLGGSITLGQGASTYGRTYLGEGRNDKCYAGLTTDYLKELFPDAKINEVNAGIGNTGSNYGIFRLQEHILDKMIPDLIFIEYTSNDWERFGHENISRQNESLIRRLYEVNPKIDIVFVYTNTYPTSVARSASMELAEHYNLVQFDVGVSMRRLAEKEHGGDIKVFMPDNIHPNDKGYEYYMTHIGAKLKDALVDNAPETPTYRDIKVAEPFNKTGVFTNPEVIDVDKFPVPENFIRIKRRLSEHFLNKNVDHYYETTTDGATFTFEFEGTGFGFLIGKSEDLSNIRYTVDGGAEKSFQFADVHFSDHLQAYIVEYDLAPGKHTVTVINEESRYGSRLRIAQIFVNGLDK